MMIGMRTLFIVLVVMQLFGATAQTMPGSSNMLIDAKMKADTLQSLEKSLREAYIFPDVADKIANMLHDRQAHGEYDSVVNAKAFSDLLTSQIVDVAHDKHLLVTYSSEVIASNPTGERKLTPGPDLAARMAKKNCAFYKVERLSGNVGYLKFDKFQDAEFCGPTVAAAMAFLANTDSLIIDLRENDGGSPAMVALVASYLFSGNPPVHLNDIERRKEGTTDFEIRQFWTLPYVPGQRYMGKEVYILTSSVTFSGAEEFTYDLQTLKRATIVGELTGGGANPGNTHRLGDHFAAFIPNGRAINPVTKTNWEGIGIKPDIAVPQQDALKAARRTALEHLIAKAPDEEQLRALKQALTDVDAE
jgi:retinol-binding protein 3